MAASTSDWRSHGKTPSTIVLNFSAALDNLFNLRSSDELATSVEQKKMEVRSSEQQLEDLDAQLRQTTERLKRLESRHRRMQSENILSTRGRARDYYRSSDSDGHSSATSEANRR